MNGAMAVIIAEDTVLNGRIWGTLLIICIILVQVNRGGNVAAWLQNRKAIQQYVVIMMKLLD